MATDALKTALCTNPNPPPSVYLFFQGDHVRIKAIVEGSCAAAEPALQPGTVLLSIDNHSLVGVTRNRLVCRHVCDRPPNLFIYTYTLTGYRYRCDVGR